MTLGIYADTKVSSSIYEISYHGYDRVALDATKSLAHTGNIYGAIIAANLFIHRYNRVSLGFDIYTKAEQCIDKAVFFASCSEDISALVSAKIDILDNKMRMIHHHPKLVQRDITESLALHYKILSLDSNYASPEVAIMYDFTLGNYSLAKTEYQKYIGQSESYKVAGQGFIWLFDKYAMKLLAGSLDNMLAGSPHSCEHPYFSEFLGMVGVTEDSEKQFFCEAISLLNDLRSSNYNQTLVKGFLIQHIDDYQKVFDTGYFGISGLTVASNLLAGKDPEFALNLLQEECENGFGQACYAVGDFQLEPVSQCVGCNDASDYLPIECR